MKPRITLLTLGVDDLERAVTFYRDGLGLSTKGIVGGEFENGAVAFFELQSGLQLALWPRTSIAHDTGLPVAPRCPTDAPSIGARRWNCPSLRSTLHGCVAPYTLAKLGGASGWNL